MKRLLKLLALVLVAAVGACWWYIPWYQVDLPGEFDFNPACASLQFSINRLNFDGRVEVERLDPGSPGNPRLKLHFVRDELKLLTLDAHPWTVFCCSDDTLYFADFEPSRTGCAIAAYSLSWGWQLWRTELAAVGKPMHRLYNNRVTLALTEKTLIVSGYESYGEYIEILDRRSGFSMGHKIYREGFLPRNEAEPPFIGGPIKRKI